jgi:hypothetical protein
MNSNYLLIYLIDLRIKILNKMSNPNIIAGRTFDPKFTHYQSDGTGRDTFVVFNNGGLSVPKVWNK